MALKFRIPDSIKIGGVEYSVIHTQTVRIGNELCYGKIDFTNCTIELSDYDCVDPQKQKLTFLHEIVHGIHESMFAHPDDPSDEEHVCDILSRGIYQVISDNIDRLFVMEPDGGEANAEICEANC